VKDILDIYFLQYRLSALKAKAARGFDPARQLKFSLLEILNNIKALMKLLYCPV
jgi:hypothetical protein